MTAGEAVRRINDLPIVNDLVQATAQDAEDVPKSVGTKPLS
jgi:hypothetical protein